MAEQTRLDSIVKDFTLEIPVTNIEESVAWYVSYLGFELVPPVLGIAELKLDSGSRICLFDLTRQMNPAIGM